MKENYKGAKIMQIDTRNFGNIEVLEEKIIYFKEGLPGFEKLKQFILLEEGESPFHYLQAIEDKDICFVIADPYYFRKDYAPVINESYFKKLGEGDNEAFALYAITCLKEPMQESTLNLAGPLLIHVENKLGVQVITEDKIYTTKHKLIDLMQERGTGNASTY